MITLLCHEIRRLCRISLAAVEPLVYTCDSPKGVDAPLSRIIDLTYPITGSAPTFPGDAPVEISQFASIKDGGYNVSSIFMSVHVGTHVDAFRHCFHSERGIESVRLESLVGWAEVLDLSEAASGGEIRSADLDEFAPRVTEGSRVILKTGWGRTAGSPEFFAEYPGVSEGAAAWLTARKIRLLGIEQPSLHRVHHLELHKTMLSAGVAIVENLANVSQITSERVFLAALPLNLVGVDGAPARVVAIEGDPREV